jgi:hypothetical protein
VASAGGGFVTAVRKDGKAGCIGIFFEGIVSTGLGLGGMWTAGLGGGGAIMPCCADLAEGTWSPYGGGLAGGAVGLLGGSGAFGLSGDEYGLTGLSGGFSIRYGAGVGIFAQPLVGSILWVNCWDDCCYNP